MTITAAQHADVLASINHTLGFTPTDSVVLLTLHDGNQLGATMRCDFSVTETLTSTEEVAKLIRNDKDAVKLMIAVYRDADTAGPRPAQEWVETFETRAAELGLEIAAGWLVTPSQYVNYFCDGDCCPPAPADQITDSAVNAHLVVAGSAPTQDLSVTVPEGPTGWVRDAFLRALLLQAEPLPEDYDPAVPTDPVMVRARQEWAAALGTEPEEKEALRLLSHLTSKHIRDRVIADTINDSDDMGDLRSTLIGGVTDVPWARVDQMEALCLHLLHFAPGGYRANLLSCLGWLQWYKGRASYAAAYLDLALKAEPGHRLAELLRQLMFLGNVAEPALNQETSYQTYTRNLA